MATRIAINGFGRIGRLVFRALYTQGRFGKDFDVVAVGDIVPADNLAYLLKYDSIQGKFEGAGRLEEVDSPTRPKTTSCWSTARRSGWSAPRARPSCPGRTWASTS